MPIDHLHNFDKLIEEKHKNGIEKAFEGLQAICQSFQPSNFGTIHNKFYVTTVYSASKYR